MWMYSQENPIIQNNKNKKNPNLLSKQLEKEDHHELDVKMAV